MKEFAKALVLASPNLTGKRVLDAQYVLHFNRFETPFHTTVRDGVYGEKTATSARTAKWELGFPQSQVNGSFGQRLYDYLRTDGNHQNLPLTWRVRRKLRLAEKKEQSTLRAKALANALKDVGIEESPFGSNRQKFGEWYGLNGYPWCAMAVSKWYSEAGSKAFFRGLRSAWAYWPENMGRAHQYGMTITTNPEPGDIVVYHIASGHIGLFKEWVSRGEGSFLAVEGNTSESSDDNGGKVMVRSRGQWNHPVFVRCNL